MCNLLTNVYFLIFQKQYIFLYRALLDCAYFGNTEISATALKTTIESLKAKPIDGKDKCKLEFEFEVKKYMINMCFLSIFFYS